MSNFGVSVSSDITELKRAEDARRETEGRYRLASRAAFEAIWDWDPRTGVTSWSEGLRAVFGYTPGEMGRGDDWWSQRVHPDERVRVVKGYDRALESGAHEWADEYRFRRKDGSYCWVTDRAYLERDLDGRTVRVVGAMMDITERKRAEEELGRRARQQAAVATLGLSALRGAALQSLFEEAVELVSRTLSVELCSVMEVLRGGELLLVRAGVGWRPRFVGQVKVRADDSHSGVALRSRGPIVIADLANDTRFGPVRQLRDHGVVSGVATIVHGSEGPFGALCAYSRERRDFTCDDLNFLQAVANVLASSIERQRVEHELRERREQLLALSRRLLEAQESERRHIARGLHDDFGQILSALKLTLEANQRDGQPDDLRESLALVDQAMERVRNLSLALRPSILDDLGLPAALRWLVEQQARQAGVEARLDAGPIQGRLPPPLETASFRLVQEALTNVARHAGACRVEVRLRAQRGVLEIAVRDDGRGFDVPGAREPQADAGFPSVGTSCGCRPEGRRARVGCCFRTRSPSAATCTVLSVYRTLPASWPARGSSSGIRSCATAIRTAS